MYEGYIRHINRHGKGKTSIDRINNDMDYCPANCRWATKFEQCSNQESNVYVVYRNEEINIHKLSMLTRIGRKTLKYRIFKMGLSPDEAAVPGRKFNTNKKANEVKYGIGGPVTYEYKGRAYTLRELSNIFKIKYATLKSRLLMYGWDTAKAVETPVRRKR